jgi:DNA-binding transcriptional LysR family regulator
VELQLAEADPAEAVAAVRGGATDLALVFEPNGAGELAGLEREVVCDDPLWAVLPVGHRLAGEPRVALADLRDDPWVAPTAFCAQLVRRACAHAGFDPDIVFSSSDYGAVQGFVAAGTGVALVPTLALTGSARVVARPQESEGPTPTIAAITARYGPRPASAEAMVGVLRDAAARLQAQSAAAVAAQP